MKLAIEHPYYCSDSNYFSNDAGATFETFDDFYSEYYDADIDMNLIFRWDVIEKRTSNDKPAGKYRAEIFMIRQRKGIFCPIQINDFNKEDEVNFTKLLERHWKRLKEMWQPISRH